jgi:hypothetical protein
MKFIRTFFGLLIGMVLITVLAEAIEFGLVTAVHGSVTTDRAIYFGIRNRPWFMALKLLYNGFAALVGGYVCAWIAGWRESLHGIVLAAIQAGALLWAIAQPDLARWMPPWMWIALIVTMSPLVVAGALFRGRKSAAEFAE